MTRRSTMYDKDQFRLRNYANDNPVIKVLMKNFINKIDASLHGIHGQQLFGLDAGCGEGHMLSVLTRMGAIEKMAAVDIRMDHLTYAKKFGPAFNYMRGDLYMLGFKDHVFDFIICTEVLEHLPDPALAMKEFSRVAKPEAHFIVSVPFEPFFTWGNIVRGKYWERGGRTPYHCNFWKKTEFKKFIASYIDICSCYSFMTFPWLLFYGKFQF